MIRIEKYSFAFLFPFNRNKYQNEKKKKLAELWGPENDASYGSKFTSKQETCQYHRRDQEGLAGSRGELPPHVFGPRFFG